MHETSMRKTSADDANREKADNETKTVVEAVRPWRQPKPTKTSRPRTLVRNDTSAVDSGADSSARVSGTAATKRKRVWGSFKPSTQCARPRRRDPPEDLESKDPKRARTMPESTGDAGEQSAPEANKQAAEERASSTSRHRSDHPEAPRLKRARTQPESSGDGAKQAAREAETEAAERQASSRSQQTGADSSASDRGMGTETPPQSIADTVEESLIESVGDGVHRIVVLPPRNPLGKKPLDNKGRECSHYRRTTPPMFLGTPGSESALMAPSFTPALRTDGITTTVAWMKQRSGLHEAFDAIDTHSGFPWEPGEDSTWEAIQELHRPGMWVRCSLRETVPKLPDHIARRRKKWRPDGTDGGLDTLIHAASMYTVHSSIVNGLKPGPLPGKGNLIGVYGYRPIGMFGASRSGTYAVYSHIGGPFYASPRYELLFDKNRAGEPGIGKLNAGDKQYALKSGMYYLVRLWLHVLTKDMLTRDSWPYLTRYDHWYPEYEIPV